MQPGSMLRLTQQRRARAAANRPTSRDLLADARAAATEQPACTLAALGTATTGPWGLRQMAGARQRPETASDAGFTTEQLLQSEVLSRGGLPFGSPQDKLSPIEEASTEVDSAPEIMDTHMTGLLDTHLSEDMPPAGLASTQDDIFASADSALLPGSATSGALVHQLGSAILQAQSQIAQQHMEMAEGEQTGFSDAEGRAPSCWSGSGQSEQSVASRASQEGQELQNKPGLDSGERDPAALAASGLGAQWEEDETSTTSTDNDRPDSLAAWHQGAVSHAEVDDIAAAPESARDQQREERVRRLSLQAAPSSILESGSSPDNAPADRDARRGQAEPPAGAGAGLAGTLREQQRLRLEQQHKAGAVDGDAVTLRSFRSSASSQGSQSSDRPQATQLHSGSSGRTLQVTAAAVPASSSSAHGVTNPSAGQSSSSSSGRQFRPEAAYFTSSSSGVSRNAARQALSSRTTHNSSGSTAVMAGVEGVVVTPVLPNAYLGGSGQPPTTSSGSSQVPGAQLAVPEGPTITPRAGPPASQSPLLFGPRTPGAGSISPLRSSRLTGNPAVVVPLSRLDCEGLRHVVDSEPVAQNDRISEWAESNPLSNTLAIEPDLMASAGSALDQRPSLARARSPGTPEAPTQSNDRVRPLSPLLVRDANWLASPEGSSGGGPLVAAREGPTILIRPVTADTAAPGPIGAEAAAAAAAEELAPSCASSISGGDLPAPLSETSTASAASTSSLQGSSSSSYEGTTSSSLKHMRAACTHTKSTTTACPRCTKAFYERRRLPKYMQDQPRKDPLAAAEATQVQDKTAPSSSSGKPPSGRRNAMDRQWTPMDKMALPIGALVPSTATRASNGSDTSLYSNTPPYEVPGRATRRHSNVFDWSQLLAESQVAKGSSAARRMAARRPPLKFKPAANPALRLFDSCTDLCLGPPQALSTGPSLPSALTTQEIAPPAQAVR